MNTVNLNLHQLMVFYNVATEKNISLAAGRMYLTQPTISYHLKSMEKAVGVKLFYLKNQRIYLTEAGTEVYQYTKAIKEQLNGIEQTLTSFKRKTFRIGTTPLLHNLVAITLSKTCRLYPKIRFELISSISVDIVRLVADMEIDMGIVMSTDYGIKQVKSTRISDNEKLVFVVSPKTQVATLDHVEWRDLENLPIICGLPGSLLHNLVSEKFLNAGITTKPKIMLSTLSLDALKIFAKEGNGVGLWHINDVETEILSGDLKILQLPEEISVAIDCIIKPNEEFSRPVIKSFLESIKSRLSTNKS